MDKPTYTDDHANKAVRRHDRRTPEERVTLLRSLLCSAANDMDPCYTGTDPNTGEDYQGPPICYDALEMFAYFIASRMMRHAPNPTLSAGQRNRINAAISEGICKAAHHKFMEDQLWEKHSG